MTKTGATTLSSSIEDLLEEQLDQPLAQFSGAIPDVEFTPDELEHLCIHTRGMCSHLVNVAIKAACFGEAQQLAEGQQFLDHLSVFPLRTIHRMDVSNTQTNCLSNAVPSGCQMVSLKSESRS
jgi:hypothetical protein